MPGDDLTVDCKSAKPGTSNHRSPWQSLAATACSPCEHSRTTRCESGWWRKHYGHNPYPPSSAFSEEGAWRNIPDHSARTGVERTLIGLRNIHGTIGYHRNTVGEQKSEMGRSTWAPAGCTLLFVISFSRVCRWPLSFPMIRKTSSLSHLVLGRHEPWDQLRGDIILINENCVRHFLISYWSSFPYWKIHQKLL